MVIAVAEWELTYLLFEVLVHIRNIMNTIIITSRVTKAPTINPNAPIITIASVQESLTAAEGPPSLASLWDETVWNQGRVLHGNYVLAHNCNRMTVCLCKTYVDSAIKQMIPINISTYLQWTCSPLPHQHYSLLLYESHRVCLVVVQGWWFEYRH